MSGATGGHGGAQEVISVVIAQNYNSFGGRGIVIASVGGDDMCGGKWLRWRLTQWLAAQVSGTHSSMGINACSSMVEGGVVIGAEILEKKGLGCIDGLLKKSTMVIGTSVFHGIL